MLLFENFHNFQEFIEHLTVICTEDCSLAKKIIAVNCDKVDVSCGKTSKEAATMRYYNGIIAMLLNDYNEAETNFLDAMHILENSGNIDVNFFADIAKHLSLAYEALGRR